MSHTAMLEFVIAKAAYQARSGCGCLFCACAGAGTARQVRSDNRPDEAMKARLTDWNDLSVTRTRANIFASRSFRHLQKSAIRR